jgi:transposase
MGTGGWIGVGAGTQVVGAPAIREAGVHRRAEFYYQQLDALRPLRQKVRRELLTEARKHGAWKLLRAIPFIGSIRAALIIAFLQTPHRFRTQRQLGT